VRRVVRTDVDLLVTSCGGEDYPDTNAMHLLRKNPSPLLICNNLKLDSPRILAAVSSADEDDEKYALDVKVLNQALGVREILGGELHVLTCWRAYLESMVSSSPRFSSVESEHHVTFARKEGESHFQHLIKAVDLPEETVKVFAHGDPGQLIPQYAREHEIDLVVMGSVGRSGVAGLLIGNTAEKIIRSLDCSIMAVKPNGFVSPIK
jgi:nucleotide-binding universal stress UspA family protein